MKYPPKPVVVLVPYPAQGHVTSMLQLAAVFHEQGLRPVVALPDFIYDRIFSKSGAASGVSLVAIPSGLPPEGQPDFFSIAYAMEHRMPGHLEALLRRKVEGGGEIVCVIVDLLASWAIEVAGRCGVPAAGFWPAMLATYRLIRAIPDLVRRGLVSENGTPLQKGLVRFLPGQPMLSGQDLPWLVGTPSSRKSRFDFWLKALHRSNSLNWLLVNSFSEAPDDSDDGDPSLIRVASLGRRCKPSPTLWEEDRTCLDWLTQQRPSSVIYVSFGSWVAPLGDEKMTQLALGLESSRRSFLWVINPAWLAGLPAGFLERVRSRGRVVAWAPQEEVLQHDAVGCYLTHCGWNSTMDAIAAEKRLVCYPVSGDQFVNRRYIVKVWGIGVDIGGGCRHDVEDGVRRVMERGEEMQRRVKELKARVMGEEGRSRALSRINLFLAAIQSTRSLASGGAASVTSSCSINRD